VEETVDAMPMSRLDPKQSALLIVDVQTRLAAAMKKETLDRLVANTCILMEAARLLGIPVIVSEQYPKGLGATVEPIAERLSAMRIDPIDKMTFDASAEPRIDRLLAELSPRSVVVVGMESHVCVFQTAREILRRGIEVNVVTDAVASRSDENRLRGLALCERAGAFATPTETVVFDWLERAGTDEFKLLSKLLR
jgi:nicotinamidase-related amidase